MPGPLVIPQFPFGKYTESLFQNQNLNHPNTQDSCCILQTTSGKQLCRRHRLQDDISTPMNQTLCLNAWPVSLTPGILEDLNNDWTCTNHDFPANHLCFVERHVYQDTFYWRKILTMF